MPTLRSSVILSLSSKERKSTTVPVSNTINLFRTPSNLPWGWKIDFDAYVKRKSSRKATRLITQSIASKGKGEPTCASRAPPRASLPSAEAPARTPSRRRRIRRLGFPPSPRKEPGSGMDRPTGRQIKKATAWFYLTRACDCYFLIIMKQVGLPFLLTSIRRRRGKLVTCPGRTRLDPVARGAREGPREAAERGWRRSSARN